ncbi:DNA-binding response regulator in two-component regulatory system with PhoR (or CreC) [uncultured delta proteobacterium]|uniref:DNA-binding response regulator in two-component regulatory system with PhoR (Or CreC) n=1 Tax=uncultured delta proteobacterium TaxID=34034 RepID=A0A212K676_9DELT|nr:DNA-binding response regulator in two-component regulatory system with PhoR (or CreC) [uncultured delta proteobacterium]
MAEATILIVEDEKDIRELLAYSLAREGFTVLEADNGVTALSLAAMKRPDLVILDLMLPGMDGLGVCRQMQRDPATADIPVIMLTAKGEEVDRIVGLELGAADYIVKPFSLREVALRIRAVLKRGNAEAKPAVLHCGPITLDPVSHTVRVDGADVDLTVTEFRLLEDLLQNLGKVRDREQILTAVWGHSFEGYSRTVDTHVRRLRAKLGEGADLIETIRGIGYRAKGNKS